MLQVDNTLKNLYKKNYTLENSGTDIQLVITFPDLDLTITNEEIVDDSFRLKQILNSGDCLDFGQCNSAMMSITVANVTADIVGKVCEVKHVVNSTYTVKLGTFTVLSAIKQDGTIFKDIVAYDALYGMEKVNVAEWWEGLTFPISQLDLRTSLFTYLGLECVETTLPNDSMMINHTIEAGELFASEVLYRIAQINGAFGKINEEGNFEFVILGVTYGLYPSATLLPESALYPDTLENMNIYDNADESVDENYYQKIHVEEYMSKEIDKLQIRSEEDDAGVIVGTGTNCYIIENNFLVLDKNSTELTQIAQNIYNYICNKPYKPFSMTGYGLPYLQTGDTISLTDNDSNGNVYVSYVLQRELTGVQAPIDDCQADGLEEISSVRDVSKEIIVLQRKQAVIVKSVDEFKVEMYDFEEDANSLIQANADAILLRVQVGDISNQLSIEEDGIDITGNRITITSTNFTLEADGTISASGGNFSGSVYTGGTVTGAEIISTSANGQYTTDIYNGFMTTTLIQCTGIYINGYAGTTENWVSSNFVRSGALSGFATLQTCNDMIASAISAHEYRMH